MKRSAFDDQVFSVSREFADDTSLKFTEILNELENIVFHWNMIKIPSKNQNYLIIEDSKELMELGKVANHILKSRRNRNQFFDSDNLFGEPSWDILLDLFSAFAKGKDISISSVCIGASVPTTTGLRHLQALEARDIISIHDDEFDGRRRNVRLTEASIAGMANFLREAKADWSILLSS
jgi:hypothetical protein